MALAIVNRLFDKVVDLILRRLQTRRISRELRREAVGVAAPELLESPLMLLEHHSRVLELTLEKLVGHFRLSGSLTQIFFDEHRGETFGYLQGRSRISRGEADDKGSATLPAPT